LFFIDKKSVSPLVKVLLTLGLSGIISFMSPDVKIGIALDVQNQPALQLTPDDQAWLASYGVDPSWQDNHRLVDELSSIIEIGSRRLDESENQTIEAHTEIMAARERFMKFVGIPDETMANFRAETPTIIPLDTFIGSQRAMKAIGLDAAKVINAFPAAIALTPESVRAKFDNLTELGLDAAKVFDSSLYAINYAPESVRAKFDNLTELGLDAAKVINSFPATINYAPESVRAKFDNLTELGLDAAKVINSFPATIGLAPESARAKMKFLDRSARILQWEYSTSQLVEIFPAVLGFNKQKLRILRRIAAYYIDESSRRADPEQVRSSLIVPLEKYILELSNQGNERDPQALADLSKAARKNRSSAPERREQALAVAPSLGRIGTEYLRYRSQ